MYNIGEISLNLSFSIYIIWFVPQILLNFKRKNTDGLSMLMHGILCGGYLCDLAYGFGREMQWQYRMVTLIGLLGLTTQHCQFGYYGLHQPTQKWTYATLNIIYLLLFAYIIDVLIQGQHRKDFYDLAGMVSNGCWFSYMLPQIIKNYSSKSTAGLSLAFVLLSITLNVLDSTSAWMLDWDYPSKIGAIIALCGNLILLLQAKYYAKPQYSFQRLAINS